MTVPWGSIASAGIGALGGALGGNEEHIGPGDLMPNWLEQDWRATGGRIGDLQQQQYFPGETVAGLNPLIQQGLTGLAGYGEGLGGAITGAQFGAGSGGAGAFGGGLDFLSQYAGAGPNQFQFDDNTFASIYNNPAIQGMKDASTRDIARQLNWQTLPGLNTAAVAAGQQGGTKLGQAGALAQGMAADRMADVSSAIDMNAYNQAIQGGMAGGTQNLAQQGQFGRDIMGGYGNLANIGLPQLQAAYGTGEQNLQNVMGAGEYFRDFDQSNINADMARHSFEQQAPYQHIQDQLSLMMGSIPGGQMGNTGMNPWEGALLGAQTGLGVYGAGQDAGWWGSGASPPVQPAAAAPSWYPTTLGTENMYQVPQMPPWP